MAQDRPKMTPRWPIWPQDGPEMAQDGHKMPEMAQDGPKMAPRWSQNGPKNASIGLPGLSLRRRVHFAALACLLLFLSFYSPDMAQDGPKMAPRWSIMTQVGPRWLQVGPRCMPARWPQDGPKEAPRCPKMAPRGPKMAQGGPRGSKMLPRWPPDGPKMAPKGPQMIPRGPKMTPQMAFT